MRHRSALTALAVAALAASVPAAASAQDQIDPAKYSRTVKTLKAGAASPVSFSAKVENDGGRALGLRKGAVLRSGQSIQIGEMTGPLVMRPRDCACDGFGLKGRPGSRLASVYVAAVRKGKTLAVAPPSQLLIDEDSGPGLSYAYGWKKGTKPFPKGTKLVVYGLFVKG